MQKNDMKIGGHVSINGGILNAFPRALEIEANCFQIFASSPRMWRVTVPDKVTSSQFRKKLTEFGMLPSFIHIKYLVNLASPDDIVYQQSVKTVKAELTVCSQLGLTGGMFHIGAPKASSTTISIQKVIRSVKEIISDTPEDVLLILENSASANKLGSTLEEMATILEGINHDRVTICIDTAHALAAKYDVRTQEGVNDFIESVNTLIGLDKVSLFHINDLRSEYGSGRDLHENIGRGSIGSEGIAAFLNNKKIKHKPFILEVPGYDDKGPDKQNIDALKSLIHESL